MARLSDVSALAVRQSVLERRSIRHFQPQAVPRETVRELLTACLWAPSPHNSQPWRFTALFGFEDKAALANAMANRLVTELVDSGLPEEAARQQAARSRTRITGAPVAILCSLEADGLVRYEDERMAELEWQMAVQSVGAALQTLFLLAGEQGIGCCWMAAPMYCPEVVREALSLPEGFAPQALVLLGYPANAGKIRPRRVESEVIELR
jgi:F420 biosynthesis protein FbiB-like protein